MVAFADIESLYAMHKETNLRLRALKWKSLYILLLRLWLLLLLPPLYFLYYNSSSSSYFFLVAQLHKHDRVSITSTRDESFRTHKTRLKGKVNAVRMHSRKTVAIAGRRTSFSSSSSSIFIFISSCFVFLLIPLFKYNTNIHIYTFFFSNSFLAPSPSSSSISLLSVVLKRSLSSPRRFLSRYIRFFVVNSSICVYIYLLLVLFADQKQMLWATNTHKERGETARRGELEEGAAAAAAAGRNDPFAATVIEYMMKGKLMANPPPAFTSSHSPLGSRKEALLFYVFKTCMPKSTALCIYLL